MKIYTEEEITQKLNKKHKTKKIVNSIIYPIVFILVICCILIVLQVIGNPKEIPNILGYKIFYVISGSMEPSLEIGDIVISKKVEAEEIRKHDIITFKQDKGIVTHRVIDIIENDENVYYQTKGDNNNDNDKELVEYKDVEGKYVLKIAKIGKIISKLQDTTSIIIIILGLYLIYKILQIKDDRKISRHEKRKELENK